MSVVSNTAFPPVQGIKQSPCQLRSRFSKELFSIGFFEFTGRLAVILDVAMRTQTVNKCRKVTIFVTCEWLLLDTEFLDAVSELPKSQSQQFCGSRLVVAGFPERIDNRLALHVVDLVA